MYQGRKRRRVGIGKGWSALRRRVHEQGWAGLQAGSSGTGLHVELDGNSGMSNEALDAISNTSATLKQRMRTEAKSPPPPPGIEVSKRGGGNRGCPFPLLQAHRLLPHYIAARPSTGCARR